jgi:DNA polymerase (family 10)
VSFLPVPLGRASDVLDDFIARAAVVWGALDQLTPAGDARRFEPIVNALCIVGRAPDPSIAIDALVRAGIGDVRQRTARNLIVSFGQHHIDLRIAAPDEYGTMLFTATGSSEHLAAMATRRGKPPLVSTEEEVYAHGGLPYIPPELRHASGEIETAAAGTLPRLVTRADIRGDLHMHTQYSDGADSLASMIHACAALGYEYIAITDHSERAGASRTVSRSDLVRQRKEIDRLRGRFPNMTVLHGIEVDIMPDGSLDFDDDVLRPLDIVLASLHDSAGQDGATLTQRCIQAIRHPLVNVITHPANRLVGRRAGYDMDYAAVFAAAAQTGTALEVDGAPGHLDMDGDMTRAAIAAGATVILDSDCHRMRSLERQMSFAVGTARRGWAEARHVLNARPLAEVRAFIAQKRARNT